jgi:acetylornithine deacetylase/succinyl-diaminopimelate desuccinylase-like protein
VLPSKASAKFSCRLVPDQDPHDIEAKIKAYIKELAPDTVRVEIHDHHGGSPVIIDTDTPAARAARTALSEAFGAEAVFIRSGGSIPVVSDFAKILGLPSVMMGFGLPDDRLHSPNEKIDLTSYFGGIEAATLFLSHYAALSTEN